MSSFSSLGACVGHGNAGCSIACMLHAKCSTLSTQAVICTLAAITHPFVVPLAPTAAPAIASAGAAGNATTSAAGTAAAIAARAVPAPAAVGIPATVA